VTGATNERADGQGGSNEQPVETGISSGWGGFVQQFDNRTSPGAHTATLNASVVITPNVSAPEFELIGSVDMTGARSRGGGRATITKSENWLTKLRRSPGRKRSRPFRQARRPRQRFLVCHCGIAAHVSMTA
jgi:hypothetical protein